MTDKIKGLKIVRGEQFPISRKMDDGSITKKTPAPPRLPKPKQAPASRKPAKSSIPVKGLKIADNTGGVPYGVKPAGKKRPQRKPQAPEREGFMGYNDDEVGAATGFLQALLGGGFQQQEPSGVPVQSSSVPVEDPALAGPPPGAAVGNAVPIAGRQ